MTTVVAYIFSSLEFHEIFQELTAADGNLRRRVLRNWVAVCRSWMSSFVMGGRYSMSSLLEWKDVCPWCINMRSGPNLQHSLNRRLRPSQLNGLLNHKTTKLWEFKRISSTVSCQLPEASHSKTIKGEMKQWQKVGKKKNHTATVWKRSIFSWEKFGFSHSSIWHHRSRPKATSGEITTKCSTRVFGKKILLNWKKGPSDVIRRFLAWVWLAKFRRMWARNKRPTGDECSDEAPALFPSPLSFSPLLFWTTHGKGVEWRRRETTWGFGLEANQILESWTSSEGTHVLSLFSSILLFACFPFDFFSVSFSADSTIGLLRSRKERSQNRILKHRSGMPWFCSAGQVR